MRGPYSWGTVLTREVNASKVCVPLWGSRRPAPSFSTPQTACTALVAFSHGPSAPSLLSGSWSSSGFAFSRDVFLHGNNKSQACRCFTMALAQCFHSRVSGGQKPPPEHFSAAACGRHAWGAGTQEPFGKKRGFPGRR